MNHRTIFNHVTLIATVTIALIFVMCSIASSIAQAKFLFETRIDYSTGNESTSVAIGDLNGDGKRNLAVANLLSDNV